MITRIKNIFPVFVKPIKGSESINITKVSDIEELEFMITRYDKFIIQEFMDGQEIGADVYIDLISKRNSCYFYKKKKLKWGLVKLINQYHLKIKNYLS